MAEDKVAVFTRDTKNVRWVLTATVGGLLISIGSVQFLAQHTITAIQGSAPAKTGEQTTSEQRRNQADGGTHILANSASPEELFEEWISSEYKNILETVPSETSDQEILEILTDRMATRLNPGAPPLLLLREQVQSWLKDPAAEEIRAQTEGTDSPKNNSAVSDIQASPQRHINIKSNVLAPFALGALSTLSMALIKTAFHATILLIRERRESTAEL